jgi:hypothetical protein
MRNLGLYGIAKVKEEMKRSLFSDVSPQYFR